MALSANLARLLAALVVTLSAVSTAGAQGGPLGIGKEPPEALFREAFATPYAQALLKQFAANVRKDGDAVCLREKGLDDAALIARGRALWEGHAVQTLKTLDAIYDYKAYEAELGRSTVAEFERLKSDGGVKKLVQTFRPAKLAHVTDFILEQFDRYVLIARIKLDPVAPVARGETEIMKDNPSEAMRANPVKATEDAVQAYLDKHSTKRIDRYIELLDAVEAAAPKGIRKEEAIKHGPMSYFAGADKELAEICVGRR